MGPPSTATVCPVIYLVADVMGDHPGVLGHSYLAAPRGTPLRRTSTAAATAPIGVAVSGAGGCLDRQLGEWISPKNRTSRLSVRLAEEGLSVRRARSAITATVTLP